MDAIDRGCGEMLTKIDAVGQWMTKWKEFEINHIC